MKHLEKREKRNGNEKEQKRENEKKSQDLYSGGSSNMEAIKLCTEDFNRSSIDFIATWQHPFCRTYKSSKRSDDSESKPKKLFSLRSHPWLTATVSLPGYNIIQPRRDCNCHEFSDQRVLPFNWIVCQIISHFVYCKNQLPKKAFKVTADVPK